VTTDNVSEPEVKPEEKAPEPKLIPESDLDALRSAKDKEIAEVRAEITALQKQLADVQRQTSTDELVASIDKELEAIDYTSEDALDKVTQLTRRLALALSQVQQAQAIDRSFAQEQYANYLAVKLVQDHGGDFETYRRQLMKATTQERMELEAEKLDLQLRRDAQAKAPKTQPAVRVDEGRGGAASNSILAEMNDPKYDLSTPEGRANWERDAPLFEKRLRQQAGAR
jgi:hypothetical protein